MKPQKAGIEEMEPEESRPEESSQSESGQAEETPVEFRRKQRVAPRRGPGFIAILLLAILGMMVFLLTR
jgi:hypothetical protein